MDMTNAPATGLKPNDIVEHISGKQYRLNGDFDGNLLYSAQGTHRVSVTGQRNGQDFGPIRFVNVADLKVAR